MNLYKLLLDIFPHLISIRKLQNYLSIDIDKINEMVALINPRKKLQVIAGSWVISVKF